MVAYQLYSHLPLLNDTRFLVKNMKNDGFLKRLHLQYFWHISIKQKYQLCHFELGY